MQTLELASFQQLAIALALGLLIGLERGWRTRERDEGMRVAGFRTHGLISLLGGLSGILAQQINPLVIGFVFLGLVAILLLAYNKSLNKFEDFSITGIIAALITYLLGVLTVFGHVTLAAAAAVIVSALMGFKPLLHSWLRQLEQQELYATLLLLLISVVMLPILPNQGYGPWAVFNPYHIWWMVVLIAGISYLGYFANKIVGQQHGPLLTGALGGLVSSTAVTLNLSKVAAQFAHQENALAAGILTACATMFARTLLLTSIMNSALLPILLPALALMSLLTYLLAFVWWRNAKDVQSNEEVRLENPFQLSIALQFGAFLAAILFLSKLLKVYFGDQGTYFLAAAAGLADVDPVTLSMAQMSKTGLDLQVAAQAILIAVAVNSGVKSAFAWNIGGRRLGLRVGGSLLAALAAGLLVL